MTTTEAFPTTPPLVEQPLLETQHITVSYGDFVAVDNVSIRVQPGEIFGLLGPNGAGKTSMIRALTTIVAVAGGTATVDGHPLTDPLAVRSCIGVLPESNGYPTGLTAPAYLTFYGQLFGLDAAESQRRATRLLDQVGLGENRNRIVTFSRGMRQRLGLARALVNDPAVLFLDEPTLGLDPAGKEDIMNRLAQTVLDRRTCVVLCSHLLDEVERVCDRVAIMYAGAVVAEGTVADVVAASGVAGVGNITVRPADLAATEAALRSSGTRVLRFDNSRPGTLEVELPNRLGVRSEILRDLLDAGVEPQAFDLNGARLGDAFLALTGAGKPSGVRAGSRAPEASPSPGLPR